MDHAWSLLNVSDEFDFGWHRSMVSHLMRPPERPPAVLDAAKEVPEFENAQQLIVEARAQLDKLLADREQAKLNIIATEEARAALTRRVAKGQSINLGQAEKIAIERAGHEQALDLIEGAVKAAEVEWNKSRAWLRQVLKHTANEVIAILSRKADEEQVKIRELKRRADTYAAWANEIVLGLNGNPSEDDLQRLLGI